MKKNGKIVLIFIGIIGLLSAIFYFLSEQSDKWFDDRFHGVWIFEHEKGNSRILLHSSEYRPAKSGGNTIHYLHLIDAKSGEILKTAEYNVRLNGAFAIEIKTENFLWIKVKDEWKVLDLMTLSEVYHQETFYEKLIELHPEIKNVYSIFFNESDGLFYVMNDQGEEYPVSAQEFDPKGNETYTMVFTSYNEMGYESYYSIDIVNEEEVEIIQIIDPEKEEKYDRSWNLVEKLDHDKGFAKNYAVILSNLTCYVLDGNQRRTLKKITETRDSLAFETIHEEDWLQGEFLRPFKDYARIPSNRCVMHYNDQFFIHYVTSMDEDKSESRLAAFHFKEMEVRWDISLTELNITSVYKPVQNHIRHQILYTLWIDDAYEFVLSAIQPNTGEILWSIDL